MLCTTSGAHSTSHVGRGSGSPLSCSSPAGRIGTSERLPRSTRTTSAASTCPLLTAERAATLDHRGPEPVVVLEPRFADRDSDAERERELPLPGKDVDRLLHAAHGAHGIVVARERHHQPIAEVLHFRPANAP